MSAIVGTIIFGIYVVVLFVPWIAEVIADLRTKKVSAITQIILYAENPQKAVRKASAEINVGKYRMEKISANKYRFVRK